MMKAAMNPQAVIDFWFAETTRPHWFAKSAAFDRLIVERFGEVLRQAAAGGEGLCSISPLGAGRVGVIIQAV